VTAGIPCPRCGSERTAVVASSPVAGVWTMSSCATCWYAWRSTEAPEFTDRERYDPAFRLDAGSIGSAPRTV
jgi:vanillate/4-hydroxybenzoate decarboxylase subunit D